MVAAAGDGYADDLKMGARSRNMCGSWRTELASVEADLHWLERQEPRVAPAVVNDSPASGGARPPGALSRAMESAQTSAPGSRAPPLIRYPAKEAPALPPEVHHLPLASAVPGRPLTVQVEAASPAGIKWIRVRYRSVNQSEDYRTLPLVETPRQGWYEATILGAAISPAYDFMYYFEVMDQNGHGRIYPDFIQETPYVLVPVLRD